MAFSKSHLFEPADQITSAFAKALSHPVRIDILRRLSKLDFCSVEHLSCLYPLSKSTISQHLEILRKTGLVKYKEEYPHTYYSLDSKAFDHYQARLLDFCRKFKKG